MPVVPGIGCIADFDALWHTLWLGLRIRRMAAVLARPSLRLGVVVLDVSQVRSATSLQMLDML